MTRPRAADDFPTIRARMEELRRERAPRSAEAAKAGPSPYHRATSHAPRHEERRLPRTIRRKLFG